MVATAMTILLMLMLQMQADKLPASCPPPLRLGPGKMLDATSRPRPRTTSHELPTPCSSPLQRQHSLACLIACLPACADRRDGAIRALRTSRPPSACSTQGTPLGTSRPSGRTSWSVGACLPQYAEAVPPLAANAATTRIGEDTLPRLASVLQHEQRRQAATVARGRFSRALCNLPCCHVERLR